MPKSSRKTLWLIAAVLVLIAAQVALLGFIVSRFVGRQIVAQAQTREVQRRVQQDQFDEMRRVQSSSGRRGSAAPQRIQRKPKPAGPRAEPPQFSRTGGIITNTITVELKAATDKAVVRYTTDGSEPTESSQAYSEPIAIRNTTLLRAACFQPDFAPSMSISHTYTVLGDDLANFSSSLPIVVINNFNQSISYMQYGTASIRFIDTEKGRATLFSEADFDGRTDLKRRGYSSLRLPKWSFTIKTRNDDGDKVKSEIFGLPSESDWVLYAPYADKTMMRDVLGYELSNQMGRYAPRTRFVEVFLNRSSDPLTYRADYAGVYVLVEKIKRDKQRVNIQKLDTNDISEPNITGGYILKRDHGAMNGGRGGGSAPRPSNDGVGFITPRGLHLFYVEPEEEELAPEQKKYLTRYFTEFERALYGGNFAHPTDGYAKYLDVDAFIDHFWLVEMTKNIDAFRYSAFLHKPRGGKITMGPAWDWNLSFGNADYYDAHETGGWYYENLRDTEISWIYRLQQDPDFVQRTIDRWAELRAGPFATEKILARVDQLKSELDEAQQRNFRKWPVLGRTVKPNYYVGPTFEAEVNWMKNWIKNRGAWIDRQYPTAPKLSHKGGTVRAGTEVTLNASSGDIYYTLDGSDPRRSGGGVSKTAKKYDGAIKIDGEAKLTARVMRRNGWSAPVTTQFTADK